MSATTTADFSGFIKPEEAGEIFAEAAKHSVVQSLSPQVPLGASGKEFTVVTGRPTANWVAEAGKKPTTEASLGLTTMTPKKLAAISVVSAEVVRANPGGYTDKLRQLIAEAFAVAFDYAALHGVGGDGTGSGPFDKNLFATTKSVTLGDDLYDDLVSGIGLLAAGKQAARGFAFDTTMEIDFLSAKDGSDRPLFVDPAYVDGAAGIQRGRILGRDAFFGEGVGADKAVGLVGDWSKTAWGSVGGITFDVSTEAAVTIGGELQSLWEHNLVAIRAEAEYGFIVAGADADESPFAKFVRA